MRSLRGTKQSQTIEGIRLLHPIKNQFAITRSCKKQEGEFLSIMSSKADLLIVFSLPFFN